MSSRRAQPQMTRLEQIRGFLFFALFFLVFPSLKTLAEWFFDHFFGLYLSEALSAMVYYYLIGILTWFLFRRFLKQDLRLLLDFLPENLSSCAVGLAGALALQFLVNRLPYPVENPTPASWAEQYAYSPAATAIIGGILMPLIEEVLFRGLVFGSLRGYSPLAAWLVSMLLFMVYSVWTFAVAHEDVRYLVLAVQYLPLAAALALCYERGGCVCSCVLLHALLNALALFQAVH